MERTQKTNGRELKFMIGDLVLVTGARGFIGWHVAKVLRQAGAKVRGLTRSFKAPLPEAEPGNRRNPEG
jgi:nucleoside-diphosphate-sugar epimerase